MAELHRPCRKKSVYTKSIKLHELEIFAASISGEIEEVTLFPPKNGVITDEESGDEEEINLNDLPGEILHSEVEVRLNKLQETDEVLAEKRKKRTSFRCSTNRKSKLHKWHDKIEKFAGNYGRGDNEEVVSVSGENKTPVQWFESVFTNEIFQLIVDMSNLYARQRNHILNLSVEELKIYIAILMCTGYIQPHITRIFWEKNPDTHNEAVSNAMRRNRFLEVQTYLHLCDNLNLPENDKFGKTREYFTKLSESFLQNFKKISSSHICIGETKIPYYGNHGSKQLILGKAIGYKVWSVTTRLGYLISFEPYQGVKGTRLPEQDAYGLGAAVVLEMERRLPKELGPYNLYFNNYFTTFQLLSELSEHGNGGTGTIRENKLQRCPLLETKLLKEQSRGAFSYQTDGQFLVVKWHDNNIVNIATNCHQLFPLRKVNRIGVNGGKRQKLSVDCPGVVQSYNRYMGGVDRFEENIHSIRISHRGKKWWFPLFAFGIDSACQNSWQLMRANSDEKISYCMFRRIIVQTYLSSLANLPKKDSICAVPFTKRVSDELRKSNWETHNQMSCNQRRCAFCKERTRIMCTKCKIGLHVHCWFKFHSM